MALGTGARVSSSPEVPRTSAAESCTDFAREGAHVLFAEQAGRALWQHTIEVNLYSAVACTQEVLSPMREAGRGAIVFISSDAAFGAIRQGIYGATKVDLIALARTIAREHGRHGIGSNVIAPGRYRGLDVLRRSRGVLGRRPGGVHDDVYLVAGQRAAAADLRHLIADLSEDEPGPVDHGGNVVGAQPEADRPARPADGSASMTECRGSNGPVADPPAAAPVPW